MDRVCGSVIGIASWVLWLTSGWLGYSYPQGASWVAAGEEQ